MSPGGLPHSNDKDWFSRSAPAYLVQVTSAISGEHWRTIYKSGAGNPSSIAEIYLWQRLSPEERGIIRAEVESLGGGQ